MTNINPVSDLRNYKEVLMAKLEEGEQSAREKGWLSIEELEIALRI